MFNKSTINFKKKNVVYVEDIIFYFDLFSLLTERREEGRSISIAFQYRSVSHLIIFSS
jgi:hypothetical protein